MYLWKLCVLVLFVFSLSDGHTMTKNFENLAFPEKFIQAVKSFIANPGNDISQQCKLDMKQYINGLFEKQQLWAWSMFDAGSKIPSGMVTGNRVDLGQFDQCLNIENKATEKTAISGKYCLGSIALALPVVLKNINSTKIQVFRAPETRTSNPSGTTSIAFATCLPSSCSTSDIQGLYSWMGIKTQFSDFYCQSKATQSKLTGGDIAVISFLSITAGVMLISTLYDVCLLYLDKKPLHSTLIAFSVLSNGKKLFAVSKNSAEISCLSGIRVISIMWIILYHRYATDVALPAKNYSNIIQWMYDEKNMFVMAAPIAVDTFFVLGGLLVSYNFMRAMAKDDKFNIITFYIHRYLRLTPLLAVIILIYVTILPHLGSGPVWNNVTPLVGFCKQYWWSTLLYIQNYVNPNQICIAQSWYLSVDTQLFVLSPIILLPLKKWPIIGIAATTILIFCSILASFLVAWFDQLNGSQTANQGTDYNSHYYVPTHTRAAPWLMGILLGYFIFVVKQNRKRIPMNKILALILWTIALTVLYACVFPGHNTMKLDYEYNRVANSFYVALQRPGWALGICWIIFACVIGYGGPVNWFLSLPMFQVAARFTYSMYLIHTAMQIIFSFQIRTSYMFSNLRELYIFWGDFAFTLGVSIIFTLAFEAPIIIIEKVIFGTAKGKPSRSVPSLKTGNKPEIP